MYNISVNPKFAQIYIQGRKPDNQIYSTQDQLANSAWYQQIESSRAIY